VPVRVINPNEMAANHCFGKPRIADVSELFNGGMVFIAKSGARYETFPRIALEPIALYSGAAF